MGAVSAAFSRMVEGWISMGVMDPEVEGQIEKVIELVREILDDVVEEMRQARYAKAAVALVHVIRDLQQCGPWLDKYYSEAEWDELIQTRWRPGGIDRWLSVPENKAYYEEVVKKQEEERQQRNPTEHLQYLMRRLFGE